MDLAEAIIVEQATHPSARARWTVSILVIAHFFAIGIAVTSYSTANFPAPVLSVMASEPLQPYLQATFLNNAYRFFAPNPGTPTVMWFRIQHEDRSVCWSEVPGSAESSVLRASYQKRLNLSLLLSQHLAPDPQSGKLRYSPMGEICMASVIRHLADEHGESQPVKSIGVYLVQHAIITPQQVRDGWKTNDLRLYKAVFAGAYTAEGKRTDENKPDVKEQPMAQVVAGILWADVFPLMKNQKKESSPALEQLRLPGPVQQFLAAHAELLDPAIPSESLMERIGAWTVTKQQQPHPASP